MPTLIGTDEAGYGPNLGPLAITGTLWENHSNQNCLFRTFESIVKSAPSRTKDSRLLVADSKVVYKPSGSIASLETSVLSLLLAARFYVGAGPTISRSQVIDSMPQTIVDVIELACPHVDWDHVQRQPGFDFNVVTVPRKADAEVIANRTLDLVDVMRTEQAWLSAVDCRLIFPGEFNQGLEKFGNKASLLSEHTLKIVSQLKQKTSDDLEIVCDKHGGRNRYGQLIQKHLTDQPISVGQQSNRSSDYFFTEAHRDVAVRFQAGGESFLPTALASMVSKYLRELSMQAWNQYWIGRQQNLKPTKGYPVDAKRFKADIADLQKQSKIDDEGIWRKK